MKIKLKPIYPVFLRILTLEDGETIDFGPIKVIKLENNIFKVDVDKENVEYLVKQVIGIEKDE